MKYKALEITSNMVETQEPKGSFFMTKKYKDEF